MRLLGRCQHESLIGAYEKPPAMPEDYFFVSVFVLNIDSKMSVYVSVRAEILLVKHFENKLSAYFDCFACWVLLNAYFLDKFPRNLRVL